jgi:uncharacterized protein (DUF433 family)
VRDIAVWHERLGRSADEICAECDLSLADVYAALAYYTQNRHKLNIHAPSPSGRGLG